MEEARATEGVQDELPHFTVPDMAAGHCSIGPSDLPDYFTDYKVAVESKQRHNESTL
jgi:hypothetical protein